MTWENKNPECEPVPYACIGGTSAFGWKLLRSGVGSHFFPTGIMTFQQLVNVQFTSKYGDGFCKLQRFTNECGILCQQKKKNHRSIDQRRIWAEQHSRYKCQSWAISTQIKYSRHQQTVSDLKCQTAAVWLCYNPKVTYMESRWHDTRQAAIAALPLHIVTPQEDKA